MSSSVQFDIQKTDILILGEGLTQKLDDTILIAEVKHPIDLTQPRKRFVLSLHYNGSNNFLFVNSTKIYQLHYYPFVVKLDRRVGSCNSLNDLSNKVCVPNKTEDINLSMFNMITRLN